jgi:nucleoredoxin
MNPRLAVLCFLAPFATAAAVSAPAASEIRVTTPTKLELIAGGKAAGSISLRAGDTLQLVTVEETTLIVRHRGLTGRVALAHTDAINRAAVPLAAAEPAPPAAPAAKPAAPAPAPAAAPTGAIARALAGKLVTLQAGALRPAAPARLAGARFYGVYFSASWCGPCKAFTPELADAYGKIRALYPEFEIVLVSGDRSAADMAAYMRDDKMPWPALAWDAKQSTREITRYAGRGIPCLVLVDENGKVLADSYRWGRYVGPHSVLDETWTILRDYRKKNPRPKG